MTKVNDFELKELHDKVVKIDAKREDLRVERVKLIQDTGITQTAYNARIRTGKFK